MYDAYDQNLLMIQRIEERKIKSLFTDNLITIPTGGATSKRQQQDSCHIHKERAVLDIRLTNIIQLDLCQFHYIEVPLYGHKKPLVIHFQFSDAAKMKFYISSKTVTPNRFNNEESFERKQILRYSEQGEHTSFLQRCLYLAIFSQQATTITAKASFGIKPPQIKTETNIRPSTGYSFTTSQFFETRRPSKDLVQLNKNVQQYEPETFRKQQMLRRVQSAQKISETLRKKKIIQDERKFTIREKFEYQEKRKIVKEILSVRNHINHFVKFQQKVWLINLYMISSVTLIKNLYYNNIRVKFTASIKKRRQYRAKESLRNMLEKQGKNIQQRTIFVGLMNLRMLAKLKAPKSKQKAKKIVHSFMMSYGQIGEIFQKTYQFKRRMRRIIDVYRNYRKKVQAYTNRIIMLWNKYWNQIYMDIKHEDQEKVTEIKKQMAKTIINYHVDEEIIKSPYLDMQQTKYVSKVQATITNQYYKEIRNSYIRKWRLFKIKLKATRSSIIAAQAFDRKQEVLFAIVDKSVLKQLVYKYMQEKGMIQSLLLKKN